MPVWQFVLGKVLQIAAYAVIVLLIYRAYKDTATDIEKESRREIAQIRREARMEADRKAQRIAERRYRRMVAETQYRVHTALRIVDERGEKHA